MVRRVIRLDVWNEGSLDAYAARMACKAAMFFYQGDLPSARMFFTVLREVREEMAREAARAEAARQAAEEQRKLHGRSVFNHWYERS